MSGNSLIIEIGARLDSAFTSAFTSAQTKITALGQELAELKRKQKLVENFEMRTQQVDTARQKLEEARAKVDQLRQAFANDPTSGAASRLAAAERSAERLTQAFQRTEERLADTRTQMEAVGLSTSNTTEQLEDLARQAERTEHAIEAQNRRMELGSAIAQRAGSLYEGLKTGMAAAAAVVVGAGGAIAGATSELMSMHKELESAERQLGMSSQTLQVWGEGAARVGIDAEKMRDIFKDVSDKLGDLATTGGGEAVDIVERLGLNVNELINMQPDQALLRIGKAMTEVSNVSQHDKIFLLESIADDASALLPLLEDNGKLLRELEVVAQKRGIIITPEEERILGEANAKLVDMKSAISGLSQEAGLMGAEMFSAFGPLVTSGIDNVTAWLREARGDMRLLVDVWSDSTGGILAESTRLTGVGTVLGGIVNEGRVLFTYLPVGANAAFTAAQAYGEMFGHGAAALFYLVKSAAASAFAAVLDIAGGVFGGIASMAGKAVGFVLDRFANMVSGLSSLGGFFSKIPGLESFGAAIGSAEGNIKAMANTARASGDVVGQSFAAQSASFRATAAESAATAQAHMAAASGAKMAAAAAIDNAKAYIDRKETQRAVNKEIESEVEKTSALKSVLDQAKDSNQKYTSTAKEKEGADKKAKGAADEHAKAAKDLASEINKNKEELQKAREEVALLTIHHQQGQEAMLQKKFAVTGLTASEVAERVALEQTKETLTDLIQKREQATKAIQTAKDELRLATVERDHGKEAMLREKYELEGLTKAQAAERVSLEHSKSKIEDEVKAREKATETLKTARNELRLATIERDQGKAAMLREKYELEGLTKAQAAERASLEQSKSKIDDEVKAREKATETLKTARDELRLATVERDLGKAAMLREKYELEGLNKVQAAERVSLEQSKTKIENEIKAREEATKSIKKLSEELAYEQTKLTQGAAAAELYKLQTEGYTKALALTALEHQKNTELVQRQGALNKNLGTHLTDSIMSAVESGKFSFKSLADSIKAEFANMILRPVIQAVMSPVGNMLGNIMGSVGNSITSSLGLGNILGGGKAGGGLLSGLGGLSSTLSSGLSGIMGSIGSFVSAIPGWGWALAGVAGLAKLFGGPSDPKLRFTQGSTDGQAMLAQGGHAGNAHNYKTAFGTVGATAASDKIGREKDFVPKFHAMMQQMQTLDQMIADTLPQHVGKFTAALKGMETSGFSTADMLKQRYQTVFTALPEELQKAMASGRDMTKLTAEEIIAEFAKLSEVAKSGLAASLQSLGLNLGKTQDSALAAAMGLTNLMGGIDKVKAANDFFYTEFFSEEERKAAALKQSSSAVRDFNKELGLSGTAAINTHAEFKKYVLGLDLTTEAGRKAYASAMAVAGSLDAVADAGKAAAAQHAEVVDLTRKLGIDFGGMGPKAQAASSALVSLMGGMDKLTQSANFYYDQFYSDKEKEQLALSQAAVDVRKFNQSLNLSGSASIDTVSEFRKYVDSLDLQTEEGRKAYAAAMNVARSMDAVADSGKTVNKLMGELPKDMIKMFQGVKKPLDDAGTAVDKNSKLAAAAMEGLSTKSKLVSDNVTIANTQLGTMKTAVVALADVLVKKAGEISAAAAKTTTTTTTSTTSTSTTSADGSHAIGLRNVPFDGYRAILHKDEAVIPARDAAILRMGMPVMMDAQTNILSLSAANDEQPVSLPAGVTALPQRVSSALSRANSQTQVDVTVPNSAPINITINAAVGQDAAQIAAEVERVLKRVQQQHARQLRAQHLDGVA
ncbi:hypothetical protein SAMN02745130_02196 [Thiothrix eikelboomii]|uniref:Bacteriophage tail tape measure C-terminal domain-containing protein n=1 Tax=Thiothrix eikelboomii TaxID=92487 RepID=A0A1T4WWX6_9GAMM|nr:phage tail tape measure C-terminal domain-containing protein [Thiothrix eikelboomii]SKA81378.1 hypothetical protein SAMN02745130_02196 [Thiothrix eikelboomii]